MKSNELLCTFKVCFDVSCTNTMLKVQSSTGEEAHKGVKLLNAHFLACREPHASSSRANI